MSCLSMFNLVAIFSLLLTICNASPLSSTSCIMPTVTTDGNRLIGYVQATATPGLANYFPREEFSHHSMIEGTAYHPNLIDRSLAEWACQYSCGENCFAFFVFWDTTLGKTPHFECRVYTAAFAKSDLVQSPKKEWTKGQAFNKQCFGPAMKFKRVAPVEIDFFTDGAKGVKPIVNPAGPYPTDEPTETSTRSATKTVTIKVKSVAGKSRVAAAVPTFISWPSPSLTTVTLTFIPSSKTSSHISPPPSTNPTGTFAVPSVCSRSSFITDGATVTGFNPAPWPTTSVGSYDVDSVFSSSHMISQLYLAADKSLGEAISKCARACAAHPQCVAFIVMEGRYSMSPLQHVLTVLKAQMADFRAVSRPDKKVTWTCDLFKHTLGAAQLVVAPKNERAIAAFNDMCPMVTA